MIDIKLQITLFILVLVGITFMIRMISKKKLELKFALIWMFLGCTLMLLTIFPKILNLFSQIIGIESPVNMLFLCGVLFLIIIQFNLTIVISNYSKKIKTLIQEVGILKHMIDVLNSEKKDTKE